MSLLGKGYKMLHPLLPMFRLDKLLQRQGQTRTLDQIVHTRYLQKFDQENMGYILILFLYIHLGM